MKILLYILIGIAIIIAALHLMGPKSFHVSRTIVVNQSPDLVFKSLCSLKEQDLWSPWSKRDPEIKIEYHGTDGEVGSYSHWSGNKEVGEGEQEITLIKAPGRIETELRFLKPWKATNKGYFDLKPSGEGTEITWGFSGENKFPFTIMMLFMNMDKAIGKDFEEGLSNFKNYIEK
ncbi:MAG: SRPBCC family protein [Marinifilaceae bacterium]